MEESPQRSTERPTLTDILRYTLVWQGYEFNESIDDLEGLNDYNNNIKIYIMEENKKTLKSLFEQSKDTLSTQLEPLSLPRDTQKVQDIVSSHLNGLLDSTGEYRQNLTQSEEFILLSAMNLLQAQQAMVGALNVRQDNQNCSCKEPADARKGSVSKEQTPHVVGGTAIGGAAGALIFNTWGALIGAIAGTAIALYYVANQEPKTGNGQTSMSANAKPSESRINVEAFLTVFGNICENVDGIIETYRVQVKRIQNTYEQKEKPTLQSDYGMLLDQIAYVCRVCETNKDGVPAKIQNAVGLLEESLENYGLKYVNGKIKAI